MPYLIQLYPRSQPEAFTGEVMLNHAYQKCFRHDSRHSQYSHVKFKKHKKIKHKPHTHYGPRSIPSGAYCFNI